jgi:hypothetical protein
MVRNSSEKSLKLPARSPTQAFIIGAAKSGTTSLARWLGTNPNVCLSRPKEPLFFEADFEKGLRYYWDTYFPHWDGEAIAVEARHRNMFLPYVPTRIASVCSLPRIVAVLRDPVIRAYSHWWHHYVRGQEGLTFEDAIEKDIERIEAGTDFSGPKGPEMWASRLERTRDGLQQRGLGYRTYIDSGYYAVQLRRYLHIFPSDHVKIIFFENLVARPEEELKSLASFLGLEAHDRALPHKNEATAAIVRWGKIGRSLVYGRGAQFLPSPLRRALVRGERHPPELDIGTRKALHAHYKPHNQELKDTIGFSLPRQWSHKNI